MKVLFFLPQFAFGGAERLAVELAERLNTRGIRADILSMYSTEIEGAAAAKEELLRRGIPAVHLLGMKVHPSIFSAFLSLGRIRKLVRENGYQVVETSSIIPSILAACALWGLPAIHVVGIHAIFRLERDSSPTFALWRLLSRHVKSIRYYGVSDYAVQQWQIYSGVERVRIRRVYNSVSNDFYLPVSGRLTIRRHLRIPNDACVVVSVGRLVSSKGIGAIYEALRPILVEKDIFLVYVGAIDKYEGSGENVIATIEESAKEQGLSSRVIFLGHRRDIPRIMGAADILAHPAGREAFGLVLVEAMAVGLPVVASNVEGITEVLAGTDSILVEPHDTPALRSALLTVLGRSEDETKRAIILGKRRAEDFRIETRADAMTALYEDALAGRF